MFALRVRIDRASVRAVVRRFETGLDRALRAALTSAARTVAESARTNHAFTNRTGRLERSIKGQRATGSLSQGTLSAEVIADTEYARFVEEKVTWRSWAYLRPALRRERANINAMLNDALTQATRRLR